MRTGWAPPVRKGKEAEGRLPTRLLSTGWGGGTCRVGPRGASEEERGPSWVTHGEERGCRPGGAPGQGDSPGTWGAAERPPTHSRRAGQDPRPRRSRHGKQSRQTASTQNGHSPLQQGPDSGWGRGWGGRERPEGTSVPESTTVELERNNNTIRAPSAPRHKALPCAGAFDRHCHPRCRC